MTSESLARGRLAMYWREGLAIALAVLLLFGLMMAGPIPQYVDYYVFADRRPLAGIPNFWNIFSNVPFLIVGVAGIVLCLKPRLGGARASWLVMFVGTALVCFGSGYFHLNPNSDTLTWDRLPMTLVLMGLFAAMVSEQLDLRQERYILIPALVVGVASVGWWYWTDDLRFYIWVQVLPLLTIALMFFLFRGRYSHREYLVYGLGFYALAKVVEYYDKEIYSQTGSLLSGHSLKHLFAATALLLIYLMLQRRGPSAPA